jgi:hypothetical protein
MKIRSSEDRKQSQCQWKGMQPYLPGKEILKTDNKPRFPAKYIMLQGLA